MSDALAALRDAAATLCHLDAVLNLLGWDEETYLPPGGRAGRGEQFGALEGLRHNLLVDPRLGDLLAAAPADDPLVARELALLARLRARELLLPKRLVRAFAAARSRSLAAWGRAREASDYRVWASAFAELLALVRERAQALAAGGDPYDALLDEHDPGMTTATVDRVLQELGARLVPLVQRLGPAAPRTAWLDGPVYEDSAQEELCREILVAIGFDFARGRLDRSTHPFCQGLGEGDVRLTNRAYPRDPFPALFGALHEGGHGLYEQGLAGRSPLLARAPGMAIHESQSRLWENLVGRSRPFWSFWHPRLVARFPTQLAGVGLDAVLAAVRRVEPGYVRVDADEVTYNLHIILRHRLEQDLLAGRLEPADLPDAWSAAMSALLGLTPPDDLRGCLQDIHWALGAFGYFPSYTLGNLYAAQLHEAFVAACPDWGLRLAAGDCRPLLTWLRDQIHRHGSALEGHEIVARACGGPLSAEPFVRHLERRYLAGE